MKFKINIKYIISVTEKFALAHYTYYENNQMMTNLMMSHSAQLILFSAYEC